MTEQVAIKHLEDHFEIHDDGRPHPFLDEAVRMAIKALRDSRWIPCSERLPEAHKNVLVCEDDGEIHLCRYNANMKRFFYDGSDWDIKLSEVIAWQPLPEAYKPEEG